MAMNKSPLGVIESVYQQLRLQLVNGELRPGDRLKISDISASLDVSTGVVREALTRLSAEGMVTATPQRGFRVAEMSAAELLDITRVRIEIESLCIRRAIELGNIEWEASVVGAYHRLIHTPSELNQLNSLPSAPWASAHTNFHDTIVSACDSPWLLKLREQLYIQSERYRLIAASMIRHDERSLADEHKEILDAVTARDAERTVKLISEHFFQTAEGLLQHGSETWLSH